MAPVGALLWRSLRTYQIYGANTDVGKTVFASVLCNAARNFWPHEKTGFLKPVSTGPAAEADDGHIERFAPDVAKKTLFQFEIPASPHLAAAASNQDNEVLESIYDYTSRRAAKGRGWLFIETAGGVHSPAPSGTPQADLYAPLRIPVVFIGDSKLGGISQTISAYESLKLRGYDVESVLLFRDDYYQNYTYLTDYFARDRGIPVGTLEQPPVRAEDNQADAKAMAQYYQEAASSDVIKGTLEHLHGRHLARISRLETMARDAHDIIWYPFTQHKGLTPDKITAIDSAHGDNFQTLVPKSQATSEHQALLQPSFDGSSSWWTQGLGHANPKLTLAASYAAGRYGHVMFASAVHEPALALAQTLLKGLQNPRLSRVFYSDNGSTGMEVAVKMGLRAARVRYGWNASDRLEILGLRGSYHGDTMGAMDSTEPSVFNEKVEWYNGKGFWFDYPSVMCKDGKWQVRVPEALREELGSPREFGALSEVFDVAGREGAQQAQLYETYITKVLGRLRDQGRKFGALVMEPVILGAGGMLMATLVKVVRQRPELFGTASHTPLIDTDANGWTGLPVVFDEVFTGLTRLGRISAASFLGVHPDVIVNAKLLTGGLVPLCTTSASDSIFRAFESDEKSDALLHGHSYTAHPVGCQVALESLQELQRMDRDGEWDWAKFNGWTSDASAATISQASSTSTAWSVWSRSFVDWVSKQTGRVDGVWALGSVLAIHMEDSEGAGYSSTAAADLQSTLLQGQTGTGNARWNVHSRVLGNVLYVMTSQTTKQEDVQRLEALLQKALG
ncbi:bifunctional dethiobiotin synthetase/7,8-diamino-pelargonic acid aminotransferase, mitochondrial [Colletotrichum spaethianum]|uniref:Bifunctional dethiobiotin synthetase/7,8-diamino-pelargonic acid aminotransferase, mitochondrial n=1 Tax=Colletotrichum spaethianum TaxID=700344 RepID=A0AA37UKF3_9PEZI|nr:bifunctional dethiobiotin synthetase/7,8-diamino-pelargonic acid aminotransferase, mitochondrial [Colletotrichum spaethianum]GKT51209.1 bifunctional dethiobiotin synthetase/7,8-diamino-pelargonic acid aminotransferase, mitochondrial [Colletotrichum spaethianum]